eukprot:TRINITY_DN9663_c0_g1_i1.p1 TRINITY_DN9663_c0_g1~~TRINITY_DN9663_c0_g1_i1.p1  ORF type:complete len:759 (+),score=149.07 TRINITY_DN9663_c0_g1_i1:60-2336(+)
MFRIHQIPTIHNQKSLPGRRGFHTQIAITSREHPLTLRNPTQPRRLDEPRLDIDQTLALISAVHPNDVASLKKLEEDARRHDVYNDRRVLTSFMLAHNRGKRFGQTERTFADLRSIFQPDVFAYNLMLTALGKTNQFEASESLFQEMVQRNISPNTFTWAAVISNFSRSGQPEKGMEIFESLHENQIDEFLWNNVIQAIAINGDADAIMKAIHKMSKQYSPTSLTFCMAVNSAGDAGKYDVAMQLVSRMRRKYTFADEPRVWSALLSVLRKADRVDDVISIYEQCIDSHVRMDDVMYSELLRCFVRNHRNDYAYQVMNKIESRDWPADSWIWWTMLDLCFKMHKVEEGVALFQQIKSRFVPSKRCWSMVITSLCDLGAVGDSLGIVEEMLSMDIKPDIPMWHSLIATCKRSSSLEFAKILEGFITHAVLIPEEGLVNGMIQMYSQCGSLQDAERIFNLKSQSRDTQTIMITAYGKHHQPDQAIRVFKDMTQPDDIAVSAVLSACGHGSRGDEALLLFSQLENYGITANQQHCNIIVDGLARSGRLDDAESFSQNFPNLVGHNSMLTGCRIHGDVSRAERIFRECLQMDGRKEDHMGSYLLMKSIYEDAQLKLEALRIRVEMEYKGFGVKEGSSWIDVNNERMVFNRGKHTPETLNMWHQIAARLASAGFKVDTKWNYRNNEDALRRMNEHVEKIALAYGMTHLPHEELIVIGKDTATCKDCHAVFKAVSKEFNREIRLKDLRGHHHFKNGRCSCGDRW